MKYICTVCSGGCSCFTMSDRNAPTECPMKDFIPQWGIEDESNSPAPAPVKFTEGEEMIGSGDNENMISEEDFKTERLPMKKDKGNYRCPKFCRLSCPRDEKTKRLCARTVKVKGREK